MVHTLITEARHCSYVHDDPDHMLEHLAHLLMVQLGYSRLHISLQGTTVLVRVTCFMALGAEADIKTSFRLIHVIRDAFVLAPPNPLEHFRIRVRNVTRGIPRFIYEVS